MSEKDGKRVLSPAEKAEADSLTNKQWLYIIGRSAERGNGEKKGRPDVILTVAERILSDIAAIATVIALGVAVFQISVGNWQFDRSGPRFSWFDTGLVSYTTEATLSDGFSGTGEVQAIVVSNTGRTGDTIVGMGRAGDGDAMVLCTPEFDEDGNLMDRDAVSVGGGTVALQPGDSRLVFAVSVHGPIPVVFCQIEVVQNGVSIQSEKAAGFSPVERKDPPPLLFGFYPIRAWVRLYDSPSNLIILP